jgi:uncharacterized protein YcfL
MKTKLAIFITIFILNGCATVTEGSSQDITFNNLPESGCQVGESFVTPHWKTVTVKKSKNTIEVICKDKTKIIESKVSNKALLGAALLDFGIVDTITGAMWFYPNEVNVGEVSDE